MENLPKVSVHVITYNQAHFIRQTLDSVLAQDYENLEIVVADDASTDGTQLILKEYAEKWPGKFVIVLNEKNLGITGNSNAAFFACTGEFIALLGGDDLFLPGKISAQIRDFLETETVVLSYHPVEIFDSTTNETIYLTNQLSREDTNSAADIIKKVGIAGPSSIMVRRSACPVNGFDMRLRTASDWLFLIEVAMRGKVVKLDGLYARYRKHENNIGRQLHKYFNEFSDTLSIVSSKYRTNAAIQSAVVTAKARLHAGEGFRALSSDRKEASKQFLFAIKLKPFDVRYYAGFIIAQSAVLRMLAVKLKYVIKRAVG